MTVFHDHPLRLARMRANLSSRALAVRAGVHRSTVQAIEEGRTRDPGFERVQALAAALHVDADDLNESLAAWAAAHSDALLDLPAARRTVLSYSPEQIAAAFGSFGAWRAELADSVTEFSGLLGVNRKVIADYEAGRSKAMPVSLGGAIGNRLQVSDEYLVAVMQLPRKGRS